MAKRDSLASLQSELARLQNDKQYEFFRPLLDHLESLPNQRADERDRDFAKGLLAVIKQLQGERQRGADVRTYIEKMAGGYIQPEWNIDGDVKQANRDFVINNIKLVFQQYGSKLVPIEVPEAGRSRALSDTKAEQRFRERVIKEHKHLNIIGRARPLELDDIYISLRVGGYIPPEEKPDKPSRYVSEAGRQQRSGIIEATEALYFKPPRLAVLGDPGSGKTTLLRYLAQRIARRDRALGDWARGIIPPGAAYTLDRIQKKLEGFNIVIPGSIAGILALVLWSIGVFRSSSWFLALLAGLVLTVAIYVILTHWTALAVRIWTALGVLGLVGSTYFGLVPWWAIGTGGVAMVVLLYPNWIAAPLAWLRRLRDRLTRYPLPFYLTLNDVARDGDSLEEYLVQQLEKAQFGRPGNFLKKKLDNGGCLILLDALDEVMEDDAYRRIAKEIAAFSDTYDRIPVVVTCRTAGFRDQRTVLRGFIQLEVQEFTNEEVERFIRTWFGYPPELAQSRVDGLLQSLGRSARMRQLSSNPLLLTMICLLYERDLRLPDRRLELYQRCAVELLEKIDSDRGLDAHARFPADKKHKALQHVAHHFHDQGVRMFGQKQLLETLEKVLTDLGYEATDTSEFLQELMARSGLIRQQSKTSYSFAHFTFQEFFTAEHLYARGKVESPLAHQDNPWWREVILLYTGLQPDATLLLRRLKERDVLLAADALADANDPGTRDFQKVAAEIIGELKNLFESDSDRRQEAADSLAAIGKWGASDYLVERIRAEGKKVISLAAALAVDRAGDRTVLAGLCEPLGLMLCLLTGHLGNVGGQLDKRILSLLDRLGLPMVFVPAGEFLMGEDSSPLRLDNYWIGKFPVTNTLYQRFTNETEYKARSGSGWPRDFKPGKENHPAVWLNFHDAVEFCKWSGTMLPSEAEWEKAARGTDGRRYPWGEQWDAARCNVSGRGTTLVDAYPNGVSPYGCFDMSGNINEWTRSHYKPYPYDPADGREALDAPDSVDRVLRGGSWSDFLSSVRCSYRFASNPFSWNFGDNSSGFRIVVSPTSAL